LTEVLHLTLAEIVHDAKSKNYTLKFMINDTKKFQTNAENNLTTI